MTSGPIRVFLDSQGFCLPRVRLESHPARMSAGVPDAISMLQYAANSRAEEEKHLLRKERNRQSAAVSRKRQRDHRQQLEEENARLRAHPHACTGALCGQSQCADNV